MSVSKAPSAPIAPHAATRLLVVEDDADIQETLVEVLRDEGYQVEAAGNGQEALALLQRGAYVPQLILLDMMMPVMNGEEFRAAQCARPELAHIPVILVSADNHAPARARAMGAHGYLAKPVDLDVLLTALNDFFAA